jgi:hypothetical protein
VRDHTSAIRHELKSQGSETIALTPGASQQLGTFNITGIPPVTDGKRNYATNFWGHVTTVFDPDAAGSAVNADKLGKVMASWNLESNLCGSFFPQSWTRGSTLYHIIAVMASGYRYSQPARAQLPASTDTDVTLDVFYQLPLSYDFLKKPHETAQWVGFFDQGKLEGRLDVSTILDGDYAGAVLKATTALRAWCEYVPSPDNAIGVPVQWVEREIAGGGSSPVLTAVGQTTQLTGVRPGCGLAALLWLTDATGIGMSGPDGVDNITALEVPWREQKNLRNLDPLFMELRAMTGGRVGPVAGTGTTIIHDGAGWPYTMADTPSNRPAASSQSMFLPIVLPGRDAETSKFQRVQGNLPINFTFTAAVTNPHRFLSCEFYEWDDVQVDKMFRAMGVDPAHFSYRRKALLDNSPDASKLRYTRIMAVPT